VRLAIWAFDWLKGLKGALPADQVSEKQYPKVYAWIARFNKEVNEAKGKAPKVASIKGADAKRRVLGAQYADKDIGNDTADPLGLQPSQHVTVWPTDSGFNARDTGRLVCVNDEEVVIEKSVEGTEVRLHFPRTGFRIVPATADSKL
jgi:hypothetical protein